MENYLYGLTVQGIQSYIFATNNLREIIGASEILENLCIDEFNKFCCLNKITGGIIYQQAASNIRFQTTDENHAKLIFKEFHKILLKEAPGVPFSQAIVKNGNMDELEKKLNGQRNLPLQNFDLACMGRLIARTTGDAAVTITDTYQIKKRGSIDKTNDWKFKKGLNSPLLAKKITCLPAGKEFIKEFEELAKDGKHSWLALIHIDGNGMGNRIRDIKEKNSGNAFEKIRQFSENIQKATKDAFNYALEHEILKEISGNTIPFRPITIGGDDITVIMRADLALPFVNTYLKKFEENTENELKDFGGKLTACAGIAYVKDKFPLHYSADLAEELCSYAKKKSDRIASCVQFHKVSDSFIESYEEIIERELTVNSETFANGPYYLVDNITKDGETINVATIDSLLTDCEHLRAEESPKNGMREWVDMAFNNPNMKDIVMKRMNKNYRNDASSGMADGYHLDVRPTLKLSCSRAQQKRAERAHH